MTLQNISALKFLGEDVPGVFINYNHGYNGVLELDVDEDEINTYISEKQSLAKDDGFYIDDIREWIDSWKEVLLEDEDRKNEAIENEAIEMKLWAESK